MRLSWVLLGAIDISRRQLPKPASDGHSAAPYYHYDYHNHYHNHFLD